MRVILVTACQRPELLQLTLETLAQAERPPGAQLWVAVDRCGTAPAPRECLQVARRFRPDQLLTFPPHAYTGNSFVLLQSLRRARAAGAARVYLVEEDVLVSPDCFQWHDRVQEESGCFASVAWRNVRNGRRFGETAERYLSHDDYSSIGVAWPAASIDRILEHAHTRYYGRYPGMTQYVRRRFAQGAAARFAGEGCEQDGLILRVMAESGQPCAWSTPPRCRHVGWYGYHRQAAWPRGSLAERIEQVRAALAAGTYAGWDVDGGGR